MFCYGCSRDLGVERIFDYYVNKRNAPIDTALILCSRNKKKILNKVNVHIDDTGKIDFYECPYCNFIWFEEPNIKDGWIKLKVEK